MNKAEYAAWLAKELRSPEWGSNPPPWPPGMMFGTCLNDDCEGTPVMDTEDVGLWRPQGEEGGLVTMQGLCRTCLALQLNDGDGKAQ